MRIELLTVGEAFQDLIFMSLPHMPRLGEELRTPQFTATIGGGAVITATAAARLGVRSAIVSALSADASRALRADRVRVVNVRRAREPHAITVALSTREDRSFVTFDGVNDRLQARLPPIVARRRAAHVHFAFSPAKCATWIAVAERLRARGTTTSWDFGWDPALPRREGFWRLVRTVDFVFVNEMEAAAYARVRRRGDAPAFWERAARNAVIRLGAKGSRWIAADAGVRAAAPRVRPVDTTGAGDAFNGGFLYGVLRGRTRRDCLRIGNFVGARSTLAAGGVASLPRRRELPS
jgi:sugar/nucleoside kinase (ribokinase family)